MFSRVYLCLHFLPFLKPVYLHLQMFSRVYQWLPLLTPVYLHSSMFTRVYLCYTCLPMFTTLLVFTYVYH